MTSNKLKYYIGEAVKSITKNRLTSIASITTFVATLFILGVFIVLSLNINNIALQFSRDCEIQVFISDECDDSKYNTIGENIKKVPYVSGVTKYTKEQILEEVKGKFEENADILAGLEDDNPYRNSFKVNLEDLKYVNEVSKNLAKIDGIEKVSDVQSLANTILNVANTIENISLWLVIILCVVTAFIVSNAIKVSVFARRKEINIMKYIGATDAFIRWPFIIEGIIIGIIGAIISFAAIWAVYSSVCLKLMPKAGFIDLLSLQTMAPVIIGTFIGVGIVIGVAGSVISLRKHLRV